jgi:hypothetical protein
MMALPACYQSYPRIDVDLDAIGEPCVPPTTEAERVYPGVFVLLDRSNSMNMPEYGLVYWDDARAGIESVVTTLQDDVAFGLGYFPDPICDALNPNCCGMTEAAVPVRLHNADAITASLAAMEVDGGTPTAPSLIASLDALSDHIDMRAAYILLVTDGVPNCNEGMPYPACVCTNPSGACDNATQCLDDVRTYSTLDDVLDQGVPTYVVGLVGGGGGDWIDVMHGMAAAGGTERATLVEDPEDIGPVMSELARQVVPCLFDVDPSFMHEPDEVLFDVGGVEWARDGSHTEGWDLIETDRIQFYGSPCTRILDATLSSVEGIIPCSDR